MSEKRGTRKTKADVGAGEADAGERAPGFSTLQITHVKTNLKVGADVTIGKKTLIVGNNGKGKSTIINAIELALTSRAGDIAGRVDVAREVDVMSLAPGGAGELEATVTFNDGVVAAYRTSGSTAKAKKATGDKPADRCHDEVLPIRALREAVLGSAVTARKYLLSKASGGVSRAPRRDLLPEQVRAQWDKLVAAAPVEMPTPDLLVSVLEDAGKRARAANDEAKSARSAARLVSGEFATPPSEAEIAAARRVHAEAKAAYVAADRAAGASGRLEQALQRLEKVGQAFEAAQAKQEAARAAAATIPPEAEGVAVLTDALVAAKASVGFGECLVCGGDVSAVPANIEQMKEALGTMQKAAGERARVLGELSRAEQAYDDAASALTLQQREIERLQKELTDLPAASVEAAEEEMDEAQRVLSELEAARDNWAVVQRSESVAVDAERRAAEWKTLRECCESVVARVLDRALGEFVSRVQNNLPPSDTFDLRLRDGEREVVQFGLVRDGTLHTALSGAEWARVMAAIADACVPADRYACVIPEERAFDAETLTSVMTALSASRHQVVLASPVAPAFVPPGWTIVHR